MIEACQNFIDRIVSSAFALRHAVKGTISIELAFFIPVAIAMIAGGVEFGRLGLEQIRIASAARAGAQFGVYDLSNSENTDGIIAAARLDADDVTNSLTVLAVRNCRCPDGTVQACTITCSDGAFAPLYVDVQVSEDVNLWFGFPGVPSTVTLAAYSSIRLR